MTVARLPSPLSSHQTTLVWGCARHCARHLEDKRDHPSTATKEPANPRWEPGNKNSPHRINYSLSKKCTQRFNFTTSRFCVYCV